MKNKEFLHEYWGRTELGKKMLASNNVSEWDLLFLLPNNVKKMHGLPLTRMVGKNKRKRKIQKIRHISSFYLFDIIEEIVEETLVSKISNNEFFGEFVEFKNCSIGEKSIFKG